MSLVSIDILGFVCIALRYYDCINRLASSLGWAVAVAFSSFHGVDVTNNMVSTLKWLVWVVKLI